MKILILCPHFAEYTLQLGRALARQPNISVCMIFNESNFQNEVGGSKEDFEAPNLTIHTLPHNRSMKCLVSNSWAYWRIYREFRPDIIHIQEEPKDYLVFSLALMRKPVVITIHDPLAHNGDSRAPKSYSRLALYKRYLRFKSDAAIVHGERMVTDLRSTGYSKPAAITPHGPLGTLRDVKALDPIPGRCLFFGRMQEYKGLADFIEAIDLLAAQKIDAHGVIAGRGPDLDKFRQRLAENSHFSVIDKYLTPEEVISEFGKANVVVLPYREATQSGVAAYALGIGRPLVVTAVGSLPDVIDRGLNGSISPPRQPAALAAAISAIITAPGLADSMGKASLALGNNQLSWNMAAERSITLYSQLIAAT